MITLQDIGSGVATVWNDVLNLKNMVANPSTDAFKPQYTIIGNRIEFRGLLYIPLEYLAFPVDVTAGNSYLTLPSAILDETRVSVMSNANFNNGQRQGRFFTPDVLAEKNVPLSATPLQKDISWADVPASRRHSDGVRVTVHRTFLNIRLCGVNTTLLNGGDLAIGCLAVFSPFQSEYDGSGNPPSGNDPQAFGISRATAFSPVVDYISSTDNSPFAIGVGLGTSPFSVNAHDIVSLGGFIVNLQGLSGYLN